MKLFILSFLVILICLMFNNIDRWLVVDEAISKADIVVVLGGGGGSRLKKGIALYDQGFTEHLLLVDAKARSWQYIVNYLCKECQLSGKSVDIIDGSTSTFTDAMLVKQYCTSYQVNSMLIVTDPYHTRRASLVFQNAFIEQKISIKVVSSGFYGSFLKPGHYWWNHERTFHLISLEFLKNIYVVVTHLIGYDGEVIYDFGYL